jgi:hypothetical protein
MARGTLTLPNDERSPRQGEKGLSLAGDCARLRALGDVLARTSKHGPRARAVYRSQAGPRATAVQAGGRCRGAGETEPLLPLSPRSARPATRPRASAGPAPQANPRQMPWSRRDRPPAPPVAQIRSASNPPAHQRGPSAAGKRKHPAIRRSKKEGPPKRARCLPNRAFQGKLTRSTGMVDAPCAAAPVLLITWSITPTPPSDTVSRLWNFTPATAGTSKACAAWIAGLTLK